MSIYGFVTVRLGSSRLPKKCLLPFGEGNVLEHIIRRAKHFGFKPIVCTTTLKEDDAIVKIAEQEDCLFYRGSAKDKMKRWLDACDKFGVEAYHTIDADDPFFDGELGKESFKLLKKGFDIVHPSSKMYVGGVGYSLTADIIRRACAIKQSNDTEMMWYYVEKVPGVRQTELEVPAKTAKIRLTLDYQEDYWLLCSVLRTLSPNAGWKEVEDLFVRNPDLYLVNWFRNEQWKNNQIEKGKTTKVSI